jgi:hypothetical protein
MVWHLGDNNGRGYAPPRLERAVSPQLFSPDTRERHPRRRSTRASSRSRDEARLDDLDGCRDLLRAELSQILARPRNNACQIPPQQLDRVPIAECGSDWRHRFRHLHGHPIAAASIGQVHRPICPMDACLRSRSNILASRRASTPTWTMSRRCCAYQDCCRANSTSRRCLRHRRTGPRPNETVGDFGEVGRRAGRPIELSDDDHIDLVRDDIDEQPMRETAGQVHRARLA